MVEPLTPPAAAPRASRESPSAVRLDPISAPSAICSTIWTMSGIQGQVVRPVREQHRPVSFPTPGDELVALLQEGADRGRPSWIHHSGITVPRMCWVSEGWQPDEIPPELVLALETDLQAAW